MGNRIPTGIKFVSVGGSLTWGKAWSVIAAEAGDGRILEEYEGVETPYGTSAPFKVIEIGGESVLRWTMHGMHPRSETHDQKYWSNAEQTAWVSYQAGGQGQNGKMYVLIDGSVGGVQHPDRPGQPLPPWSVMTSNDLIMLDSYQGVPIASPWAFSRRYQEPFCRGMRRLLFEAAQAQSEVMAINHGVYVNTLPGRLETPAEIRMVAGMGGHCVARTRGYELPLYAQFAHVASFDGVSNYAESGQDPWVGDNSPGAMAEFYHTCSLPMGAITIRALASIIKVVKAGNLGSCKCNNDLPGLDAFPVPGA